MVVHCNVQLWQHCDSCFKKSRRTGDLEEGLCRYLYPREPTKVTVIDKQMSVLPRRAIGSEYVIAYSSTIMLVMPTNHDIRLSAGPDVMYYALKYALKDQQAITNSALLVTVFQRRLRRDAALLPASDDVLARRRVCSLVYAVNKTQEVAAPLVAHFLLDGDGVYVSHRFAPVLLGQALASHESEEHECTVQQSATGATLCAGMEDYMCRPTELENVPLYWYIAHFEKVKASASRGDRVDGADIESGAEDGDEAANAAHSTANRMRLICGHPQAATHVVVERAKLVVPDITGPRVPDQSAFADPPMSEHDIVAAERYALIALTLFCPYRRRVSAGPLCASLHEELARWRADERGVWLARSILVLGHAQDYFKAKNAEKEGTQRQQDTLRDRVGDALNADGSATGLDGVTAADEHAVADVSDDVDVPCAPEDVHEVIADTWTRRRRRVEGLPDSVHRAADLAGLRGVSSAVGQQSVIFDGADRVRVQRIEGVLNKARRGAAVVDADKSTADGVGGNVDAGVREHGV